MAVYNNYDLQLSGLIISTEIGCLGHFMPDTLAQVANACEVTKKTIRSLAACIAVFCSYRILILWTDLSVCLTERFCMLLFNYHFSYCNLIV